MVEAKRRPARVLMTTDTLGDVWTYSLELGRALCARRVEVALATMGAPLTPEQWAAAAAIRGLRVFEGEYRLEWMNEPWDDIMRAGDWLLGIESELRPDVVHLNHFCHGALPWRAPTLMVAHSCVLSWWRAVHGESSPPRYQLYRDEVTRGLQAVRCVVAPTRAMLAMVDENYGRFPNAVVIPNGRDPALFCPSRKEPFIISAGRLWDQAKNTQALEDVSPRIAWPICVAGDPRGPDGRRAEFSQIVLLGPLSPAEIARWFSRAAVYASPARYEPFGLSALAAALSGCALVLGDIPSSREVWDDAALYVPPDDVARLESALVRLMEDSALRASMALRARARALRFTAARMTERYLTVYRDLCGRDEPQRILFRARAALN